MRENAEQAQHRSHHKGVHFSDWDEYDHDCLHVNYRMRALTAVTDSHPTAGDTTIDFKDEHDHDCMVIFHPCWAGQGPPPPHRPLSTTHGDLRSQLRGAQPLGARPGHKDTAPTHPDPPAEHIHIGSMAIYMRMDCIRPFGGPPRAHAWERRADTVCSEHRHLKLPRH